MKRTLAASVGITLALATSATAEEIRWNVIGPASFFQAANWDPQIVPGELDDVIINNGGTAVIDTPGEVGPFRSLEIGSDWGGGGPPGNLVGSLHLMDMVLFQDNPFSGTGGTRIGSVYQVDYHNTRIGLGEFVSERVENVEFFDRTYVGAAKVESNTGGTAGGIGTLRIDGEAASSEDTRVYFRDDLYVGYVSMDGGGAGIADGTLLIENVNRVEFDEDLEVAKYVEFVASSVLTVASLSADVTFRNIPDFTIRDIDILDSGLFGQFTGLTAAFEASVTFEDCSVTATRDIDFCRDLRIWDDALVQAQCEMNLIRSTLKLTSQDYARIGEVIVPDAMPHGDRASFVDAAVNMEDSWFDIAGVLSMGYAAPEYLGTLDAVIRMRRSLVTPTLVFLEDHATLAFHVEGTDRIDEDTIGADGSYSTMVAFQAALAGALEVHFDSAVSAGDTFDLLEARAISGDFASFHAAGLPDGLAATYEIVEAGTTEVVRVTVEEVVILTCPGDFDANGFLDFFDVLFLLANWGEAAADLNGDGTTGFDDLLILMSNFGSCA